MTSVVSLRPAQPLLTVGGISRGALADETSGGGGRGGTQYCNKQHNIMCTFECEVHVHVFL